MGDFVVGYGDFDLDVVLFGVGWFFGVGFVFYGWVGIVSWWWWSSGGVFWFGIICCGGLILSCFLVLVMFEEY